MKKYYILQIDSYDGEGSSLFVDAAGSSTMYVMLMVENAHAAIVDWGYSSVAELVAAWADVKIENLQEFI